MINKDNFEILLQKLGFSTKGDIYIKDFSEIDASLKVDFKASKLIYPEDKGFKVNEKQTCNFSQNENFVVFECVHRLFEKGYKPQHIELEPRWKVGLNLNFRGRSSEIYIFLWEIYRRCLLKRTLFYILLP